MRAVVEVRLETLEGDDCTCYVNELEFWVQTWTISHPLDQSHILGVYGKFKKVDCRSAYRRGSRQCMLRFQALKDAQRGR